MALNEHIPHPHILCCSSQGQHHDCSSLHACPSARVCLSVSLPPTQHVLSLDPALTALLWPRLPQPLCLTPRSVGGREAERVTASHPGKVECSTLVFAGRGLGLMREAGRTCRQLREMHV